MSFGRPLGGLSRNNVTAVRASLKEGEMLCPTCDGEGVRRVGHSFRHGNLYEPCHYCGQTGKVEIARHERRISFNKRFRLKSDIEKLPKITTYERDGRNLSVRADAKGKHQEYCLCHMYCVYYKPDSPDNCEIAQKNLELCKEHGVTLPVFECPKYEQVVVTDESLDVYLTDE